MCNAANTSSVMDEVVRPFRRWKFAKRDQEIIMLRALGWTYEALSDQFGLSRSGVHRVIGRYHLNQQVRSQVDGATLSTRAITRLNKIICPTRALTIGQIAVLHYDALKRQPDLGKKTVLEIAKLLRHHGIEMQGLPKNLRSQIGRHDPASTAAHEECCWCVR
jgi:hypothetical protein